MIYGFYGFGLLRGATGSGGCNRGETKPAPRIGRNGPSIIRSCPYLGVILFASPLECGVLSSASKSRLSVMPIPKSGRRQQAVGLLDWLSTGWIGSNGFMAALCLIKHSLPLGLYFYFYASPVASMSAFYLRLIMGAGEIGNWRRFYSLAALRDLCDYFNAAALRQKSEKYIKAI